MNQVLFVLFLFISSSFQDVPRDQYTSTSAGEIRDNIRESLTVGVDGPTLLKDSLLIERLAIQNRERIPERTVHARGFLAKGSFVVSNSMSNYTMASFLQNVGQTTPLAVRFSTVIHPKASPEFLRDPRGFAIKFYTSSGNYDFVGINFPVFFIRDGIRFPDLIRSFKPDPLNGQQTWWRIWDFLSYTPESLHMLTFLLDDVGIPLSYRFMHGNGVHAYKWINANNQQVLVKYHWECLQGEQNLQDDEAILQGFSFATFDLYNATQNGNYPQWKLQVQMMPVQDSYPNLAFDPLDPTVEWPLDQFPYIDVGTMTLNETGHDFYDNEQSAFSPSRFIPGITASNDKLLQARLFSYPDAQRYRLGINNELLPINAPKVVYYPPQVEGKMNFLTLKNMQHVNYFPSNFTNLQEGPPQLYDNRTVSGTPQRSVITKFDDYTQPRQRYLSFPQDRQMRFAQRIAERLVGSAPPLIDFWIKTWATVDPLLGTTIQKLLASNYNYDHHKQFLHSNKK